MGPARIGPLEHRERVVTACPLHPDAPTPCAPCGVNRVRAALGVAPRTRRDRDDDPNPTRARAIARARTDRTNTKEQP